VCPIGGFLTRHKKSPCLGRIVQSWMVLCNSATLGLSFNHSAELLRDVLQTFAFLPRCKVYRRFSGC